MDLACASVPLVRALRFAPLLPCGGGALVLALAGSVRSAPASEAPRVPVAEVLRPPAWVQWTPGLRGPIQPEEVDLLMKRLQESDRGWVPRTRVLPDGRVQVTTRRLPGDPALSQAEVEAMIRNPPSFERERAVIRGLLDRLRRLGVTVTFETLVVPEAIGQWDPTLRRISLRPDLPDLGSRVFARVLNHEAIHIGQSCSAGGVQALPRPIGLGGRPSEAALRMLAQPIYRDRSPSVKAVEAENYANQDVLGLGIALIDRYCPGGGAQPGRLAP